VAWSACLVGFIVGSASVHFLPTLPSLPLQLGVWLAWGLLLFFGWRYVPRWRIYSGVLFAILLGWQTTVWRAEVRLADRLHPTNVDLVSRVVLQVVSLPQGSAGRQRFVAKVLSSIPDGVPQLIQVSWQQGPWRGPYAHQRQTLDATVTPVRPGEIWRMALVLRPPTGLQNPGGFDYEQALFAQGIRAVATVRGQPKFIRDRPWSRIDVAANRWRYHLRTSMQAYLQDKPYGAVLLALSLGDQASVAPQLWTIFNRAGLTHLMAISGTHITLVSGLMAALAMLLWRRLRWREQFAAEAIPAQVVGAVVALGIAFFYCLLAGWGVPARRSFFMLAVVVTCLLLRLAISRGQVLLLAAFVVIVMDPWAVLSAGFFLSFAAVAVLLTLAASLAQTTAMPIASRWGKIYKATVLATRLQLAITIGLFPILAVYFHEISLISPLANAVAIPVIGSLVTPLSLLFAFLTSIPHLEALAGYCADLAHTLITWVMWPTERLVALPWASVPVAHAPVALTVLALLGVVYAFLPRGVPGRWLALLLIVPALQYVPPRPAPGQWWAWALDVGQASAIVVQTANHTLLFDTGNRFHRTSDSALQVILPFLRYQGIRRLDGVIVSHDDLDHVGGLYSLLDAVAVDQLWSSFDSQQWLAQEAQRLGKAGFAFKHRPAFVPCYRSQTWTLDGVQFRFHWPPDDENTPARGNRDANANSCVLSVRGKFHHLLLPGDIYRQQETELMAQGLPPHDVVLAAHHGSKTSSHGAFVEAIQAQHVIMQAGAFSRYGHPHPQVLNVWQAAGTRVWRNDQQGAIHIQSAEHGLRIAAWRAQRRRYWR